MDPDRLGRCAVKHLRVATVAFGLASVGLVSNAIPSAASQPIIKVGPPQVTFGVTTVGDQSKPREVRWTNTSDVPIQIFNWVLGPGEDFDFSSFESSTCAQLPQEEGVVLAPHTSCSFEIVFHPSTVGSIEGEIVFSYFLTSPTEPEPFLVVPIRGIGKP